MTIPPSITLTPKGYVFFVKVIPKAKKAGLDGWEEGRLKVKLHSPPERGAANKELIEMLAKTLGIKRGQIEILSGETSRIKRVAVDAAVNPQQLLNLQLKAGD
ncbi:DUF167 domain-containing protein [Estrella lausannensis]|uniref:UPF0235 protein ELAC_2041 n=1 Tax=Estrella lausannensis TaxID=483423 RepID=A0A0H5DRV8_9BACT|nr:DUF167 domain-containing protein [Estrella lausannensis]CRX39362.1 conserved hypothetical protein [Estrella lausannensis]